MFKKGDIVFYGIDSSYELLRNASNVYRMIRKLNRERG